ncbi:hypothetical protein F5Y18DRAFT_433843 [Xylariaceae sp. FL1019]|nr:hypothetical protein F5Y18DRAFT_433843 [Xylariaceae sp. FL1019]
MAPTLLPNSSESKPLDISNLMSPPEVRYDSFSHSSIPKPIDSTLSAVRQLPVPYPPLSPPISPAVKTDDNFLSGDMSPSAHVKDPILYPTHDTAVSPPQQPLFAPEELNDSTQIVNDHVSARPTEIFKGTTPPKQDDYELALYFKSQLMAVYLKDPKSWLKRERALLKADNKARAQSQRNTQFKLQPILPAKPQAIRKEAQRPKPAKSTKVVKQTPNKPRPIRAGPSPASTLTKALARAPSGTPDPSPRRAAAPNRVDVDFDALPDFCPPRDSLPPKPNSLKVDWKGTPTDLSDDPDRHLLHPDEVLLASNLRLSCATYLTSKRRIFIRRLECLRTGKEFRRTDAQQACKIDVNKASKLWAAFEKVDWLNKSWVQQFL